MKEGKEEEVEGKKKEKKRRGKDLKMRIDIPVTRLQRDSGGRRAGGGWQVGGWGRSGAAGEHEREADTFVIILL